MVSILIVSHSDQIARGVKALADQMTGGSVPVFPAGGLDKETLGTNVETILKALEAARSPEGTLVLMDLGSALLSAEAALELLPPEVRSNVRLCAAPLVEGALAAAVQASTGADLDTVESEAKRSISQKSVLLGLPLENIPSSAAATIPDALQIDLVLLNPHGLHARPAARFVRMAAEFDAEILVENLSASRPPVTSRSLNALATLGLRCGDRMRISASGIQAAEALESLRNLVQQSFGEPPEIQLENSTPPAMIHDKGQIEYQGRLSAIPIVDGYAVGPLTRVRSPEVRLSQHPVTSPELEQQVLKKALVAATRLMLERRDRTAVRLGEAEAMILDAHVLILQDPELLTAAFSRIESGKSNASQAWDKAVREVAASYEALEDPYQRRRKQDVLDVGRQVAQLLADEAPLEQPNFESPVILVVEELDPSLSALLDPAQVLGIASLHGGPTSHSAILVRALGIPAVSGLPYEVLDLPEGTLLALDGTTGTVWIEPAAAVQDEVAVKREAWLVKTRQLRELSRRPGETFDGTTIQVAANVGSFADAQAAQSLGAEGIGVLRSEFLFLNRSSAPDEQEQLQILRPIFECMEQHLVIVRTLDAGGDKPLPYLPLPPEANPFLGLRAIRLSIRHPDLLRVELRAILRAAAGHQAGVMFPMIADGSELLFGLQALEEAHRSLERDELPHAWPVQKGIMIEVPSAALLADQLASQVDFFSIGTNDLTQYTLAAERGSPHLASFQDALHPAVLRLIQRVALAGAQAGKWVGVCGEIAADPAAIPILVGLGVRELSMNPAQIPNAKQALRSFSLSEAQSLADRALSAGSAENVRALTRSFL